MPNTLRSIDEKAFENSGLREIVLPEGLQTIYFEAFNKASYASRNSPLVKISIGNNVDIKDIIIDGTNNFRSAYLKHGPGTYVINNDQTWSLVE